MSLNFKQHSELLGKELEMLISHLQEHAVELDADFKKNCQSIEEIVRLGSRIESDDIPSISLTGESKRSIGYKIKKLSLSLHTQEGGELKHDQTPACIALGYVLLGHIQRYSGGELDHCELIKMADKLPGNRDKANAKSSTDKITHQLSGITKFDDQIKPSILKEKLQGLKNEYLGLGQDKSKADTETITFCDPKPIFERMRKYPWLQAFEREIFLILHTHFDVILNKAQLAQLIHSKQKERLHLILGLCDRANTTMQHMLDQMIQALNATSGQEEFAQSCIYKQVKLYLYQLSNCLKICINFYQTEASFRKKNNHESWHDLEDAYLFLLAEPYESIHEMLKIFPDPKNELSGYPFIRSLAELKGKINHCLIEPTIHCQLVNTTGLQEKVRPTVKP